MTSQLHEESSRKGILYLCATPIGNLEDITLRALRVLKEVDLIAAEDTRQTLKLMNHFNLSTPLTSYYEHNKLEKGNILIQKLLAGQSVALVSDAGTPGISDPGEDLVRMAVQNRIQVTMVPGPVAAIAGVVLSGLPSGRFVFEGFLPMNKRVRKERLEELKEETRTIVLYEAPHKLPHTLEDLLETLGNRNISIARELTKKFEEILRCDLETAVKHYRDHSPRGEYVVVIQGLDLDKKNRQKAAKWDSVTILEHVEGYMNEGYTKKEAMKKTAEDRGVSKRDIYKAVIE